MPDIQFDRTITTEDISRLRKCFPPELDSRLVDVAFSQKRHRSHGQQYLAFSMSSDLSEDSHRRLLENQWSAQLQQSNSGYTIELAPLRSLSWHEPCYHATHGALLASIQEKGLLRGSAGAVSLRPFFSGAKYFIHISTSIADAIKWATFRHLLNFSEPVYLRVDMQRLRGPVFGDPSSSTGLVVKADCIPWEDLCVVARRDVEGTLWDEMGTLLSFHKCPTDSNGDDVLNRLFREFLPDAPALTRDGCKISLAPFLSQDVEGMARRDDTNSEPRRTDVPIVVVRWGRHDYVVDGRRRANKRIRESQKLANDPELEERPLSGIIIEPRD